MPQTPNHGYNVPNEGAQDWHRPLNENFEQYDTDIEIRDTDANKSDYEPKEGAKFLATDTGKAYVGDGGSWNHVPSTGQQPTLSAINTDGTDLGVGTANPATKLHVADDPVTNGPTDLSRPAAVIENTSGAARGDVLGLKSDVPSPDTDTDFLSFIGGNSQLGQLNGNGANGIRLASSGPLTLSAAGKDVQFDTDSNGITLSAESGEQFAIGNQHLVVDGSSDTVDLRKTGGVNFDAAGAFSGSEGNLVYTNQTGDPGMYLAGNGDLSILGEFTAPIKNFVQSVDTDDGEKEVVYTSTEAPTPRTEASGVAELEDGRAEVDLPDHFGWVTDGDEPIHVQITPYSADSGGLAAVERSTNRIVVEDRDGAGDYAFAYTVRGTRDGYADKEVVREPAADGPGEPEVPADD